MTGRALIVHGTVAAVSVVTAWITGERAQESKYAGEAIILEARKGDIEKIRYEDEKIWTEVTLDREAGDLATWVHTSAREQDQRGAAPGAKPTKVNVPERVVRGGRIAKDLIELVAPYKADRALGVLDGERLEQLGLAGTKRRLTITARGIEHRFKLAAPPPGALDPYLQSEEDGAVYLVGRTVLNTFVANGLPSRETVVLGPRDYDRVVFKVGDRARELRASPSQTTQDDVDLTLVDAPETRDNAAENWFRAIRRTEADDVLGRGEVPAEGNPTVAVRLEFYLRRDRVGFLEVGMAGGGPSVDNGVAFARSEHSAGWLRLPRGTAHLLVGVEKLVNP